MAVAFVHRGSQFGSPCQPIITAMAACAFAMSYSSTAFTLGPSQSRTLEGSWTSADQRIHALPSVGFHPQATKPEGSTSMVWQRIGLVGFALASVCQVLTLRSTRRSQNLGRKSSPRVVVRVAPATSKFASTTVIDSTSFGTVAQPALVPEASTISTDLESNKTPALVPDGSALLANPFALQTSFVAGSIPEILGKGDVTHTRRGVRARRVGSARCKSARRASATAGACTAEKTSRRRIGAKIQSARSAGVVVPPSFDASRLRMKLQVGLRHSCRVRPALARETKTTSATVGNSRDGRVFVQEGKCASEARWANKQTGSSSTFLSLPQKWVHEGRA